MNKISVFTPAGKGYTLYDKDEIARGGEGRIIALTSNKKMVAKIYHKGTTPISNEQFNYLNRLDKSLFVVPCELLLYDKNTVAGFLMEYLDTTFFPLSAIFSKNFCTRNGISPATKRRIAEKLIRAVRYAHSQQLVIGDLNQYNILINKRGDLKLIDVDSYETPKHKHSGILLEEIRDYLYGGKVTENSDFYAISVLIFNMITYTHPFKGIHKRFKKLSERIVHRLPVFVKSNELKVPKCYQPVADINLQSQFEGLYIDGNRFLLSFSGIDKLEGKTVVSKKVTTKIVQKNLTITPIIIDAAVYDIVFNNRRGFVETKEYFIFFDAKNKGYLSKEFSIPKDVADRVFFGDRNIIVLKNNKLKHYINSNHIVELTNILLPDEAIIQQFGNVLMVVGNDLMYHIYIDNIIGKSVMNKRTDVFSQGFRWHTGVVQNTGGVNRIFYFAGKDLANVKINISPKQIYQQGNIAIIEFIENKEVNYKYLRIDGLKAVYSPKTIEVFTYFAYLPRSKSDGFIFEPNDNRIDVLSTNSFKKVSEIECDLITSQSKLQYTNAGLLAAENRNVYLLNTGGGG